MAALAKTLERQVEAAARKYHAQRLATALAALERSRVLPHLHPLWHRINNQIRNEIGVRRTPAIISSEDAAYVKYLETTWRYDFGSPNRRYPNIDTFGGPIRPLIPHSNFKGERIQVLSGQFRGELGRTIGLDSTAELMIELDSRVQLFASEMWWTHRHDHCLATCPVCGESFIADNTSEVIEQLRAQLSAIREEMIECQN